MRFAFCNEGFGERPWAGVCEAIRAAGYDGVEIAPYTFAEDVRQLNAHQRTEIARVAGEAGLEVVGLHWLLVKPAGLHISHPDPSVRARTRDYLSHLVDFCADLGGKVMVFGSPQQRGTTAGASPEEAWGWAKETFVGVLPVLAERGITLCLEPLTPADTDFIVTAVEGRRFVQEMNHPNFRLLLDVKAMAGNGEPILEALRENADLLAHFHANDANLQGPGYGPTDFAPIMRTLREIGYDRYVSVEPFTFTAEAEEVARVCYRYLASARG